MAGGRGHDSRTLARSVKRGASRGWWRRWPVLPLALGGVAVLLLGLANVLAISPPARASSPTRYGADYSKFHGAVNATWPQSASDYCGVATIAAIATYLGHPASQTAVAAYLNSSAAESAWGSPSGHNFLANISLDFGSDPRSLAQGLTGMTGGGYSQFVGYENNYSATLSLVSDLYHTKQPISVIVDNGAHSVVVDAVYATGNPVTDPGSITSLEMWDPAYGSGYNWVGYGQVSYIGMRDWLTNIGFWGGPYSSNGALDPDPAVGPYTYNPSKGESGHLWIGHYVYFRPFIRSGATADWAFNQNFALIRGAHNEIPKGYTGPSVPLVPPPPPTPTPRPIPTATPTPKIQYVPPPPPTPTARPKPKPKPKPKPTPTPTPTPEPTATPTPTPTATPVPAPAAVEAPMLCAGAWCLRSDALAWWSYGMALALALGLIAAAIALLRWRARLSRAPALVTASVKQAILPPTALSDQSGTSAAMEQTDAGGLDVGGSDADSSAPPE